MPELPEVETVRRGLSPAVAGRRIERVIMRRRDLRFPLPDDMGQRLTGRRLTLIGRRAKYLLFHIESGDVLISHLGMSGRFRIFAETPPMAGPHDHVEFHFEGGVIVRYNDPRRFGFMELTTAADLDGHAMLSKLGPEPIEPGLDGPALAERLAGRGAPIKAALLDQSVIAGLGNIYVSEALFEAGLSPRRRARTVVGGRAAKLAAAIQDVLGRAIAAGGSTLQDHRQPSGELGYFQHAFRVYGRTGETCPRCGAPNVVAQIVQSGRSTFFCSRCQR